jgi:hypothetical protein
MGYRMPLGEPLSKFATTTALQAAGETMLIGLHGRVSEGGGDSIARLSTTLNGSGMELGE